MPQSLPVSITLGTHSAEVTERSRCAPGLGLQPPGVGGTVMAGYSRPPPASASKGLGIRPSLSFHSCRPPVPPAHWPPGTLLLSDGSYGGLERGRGRPTPGLRSQSPTCRLWAMGEFLPLSPGLATSNPLPGPGLPLLSRSSSPYGPRSSANDHRLSTPNPGLSHSGQVAYPRGPSASPSSVTKTNPTPGLGE